MRLAALGALLAGCAWQPELTVLCGPRWINGTYFDVACDAQLLQRFGKRGIFTTGVGHDSNPARSGLDDTSSTTLGVGFTLGGGRRE